MTIQRSGASRDAGMNAHATTIGASPSLVFFSGALGANCAAADPSGTLATLTLPASPFTAASGGTGVLAHAGTWTGTASATGTAASYRIKQGATCHEQGTCGASATAATSAASSTNANTLTFASAPSGFAVDMNLSGTGIPAGTKIVAIAGGTVTVSRTLTAGVASGTTITAAPDLVLNNASLASGQTVTTTYSLTAADA